MFHSIHAHLMLKSDICILKQQNHLSPDVTGECKMDTGGYFIINGSKNWITNSPIADILIIWAKDENNIQYAAILEWVAAGNTIADAD